MAANWVPCPVCGSTSKRKRKGRHPRHVWECRTCGALFRVPSTVNPSHRRNLERKVAEGTISADQAAKIGRILIVAPPTKPPYAKPADGA